MLYDPVDDKFEKLSGLDTALEIDDQIEFSFNSKSDPSPGQIICIATDGIRETQNSQGEMFGRRRMQKIIRQNCHLAADKILSAIIDSVGEFRAGSRQEDDITLVIVNFDIIGGS